MKQLKLRILAAAAVTVLISGCATEPAPYVESQLGDAVRTARMQQTIDLDGSKNTNPVAGMDGVSAKTAVGRYQKSFEAPPPTFTVINVGGAVAK